MPSVYPYPVAHTEGVRDFRPVAAPTGSLARRISSRAATTDGRRPIRLKLLLGLTILVVAVGGVLAVHAAWTYRPLATGSLGNTSVWLLNGSPAPTQPAASRGPAPTVWLIPSSSFNAGIVVDVANHGRFGVTVDHIGFPTWGGASHYVARLESLHEQGWTGGTPFRPFHLESGQEQAVVLRFEMACVVIGPNSTVTFSALPVEYDFMGIHHTSNVALAEPFVIGGPSSCPGR